MKLSGRIRQYPTLVGVSAVWLACSIALASCGYIEEKKAYIYGLESYVYGYPLVMMDVTRKVLTAAPAPNACDSAFDRWRNTPTEESRACCRLRQAIEQWTGYAGFMKRPPTGERRTL